MSFKKLLAIDSMFEGGRMFVGAMSVSYLLNKGISIEQVGLLKSIQATTILLGEYPTGVISDLFGHKRSLTLSLLSAILSFILYAFGTSISYYIAAEILAALSLSFWSGAYEAFAIEKANLTAEPGMMDRFFHLNQGINSFAVLFFGVAGGLLTLSVSNLPYLLGILILIFSLALLTFIPSNHPIKTALPDQTPLVLIKNQIKSSFTNGILDPLLFPFFIISIIIQFSVQPLLHLWQPLFSNLQNSPHTINSIVFGAYCSVNTLSGIFSAHFSKKEWFRKSETLMILLTAFSVFYVSITLSNNWIITLVIFAFMQGLLATSRTLISIKINSRISNSLRASVLSSVSLFSRFGMLFSLQWIQILSLKKEKNVTFIFDNFSSVTILVLAVTILFSLLKSTLKFNKRGEAKNEY